ncbi:MAG: ATP-binding cassette domain-containing protein [Pedosphaera sp.]|nr:ATP-binding cassette domain-containing protein [Pedosphaera sp.]
MALAKQRDVLRISDLSIRRNGVIILDDISWRIRRGEHWVILGSNGSGKTSLLSALTGYLMPTEGSICLLGETYGQRDWRDMRKRLGLVSSALRQMMADTEPALDAVASGRHAMIDYWGRPNRREQSEARRILARVECSTLAERPWSVLSQGERQRILIGRALMARPRLLILDEPCAGLDPVAREHFLAFVDRLARGCRAPTIVLVTHHIEEVVPAFTHALCLRKGKTVLQGPCDTVFTSRNLTRVFGAPVRIRCAEGRYSLRVSPRHQGRSIV